ncbi:TA system VapC family ribonuclease toxin [Mycobacterium haemophilum]|uniref:Ribonuclease VapC n=1 Tax=Mycobacterium haemophilum TaxID=29311 RepID=A0A0I9U7K6_9MYCO|nr:TA system VapC family ribonuclease toxin [Mycobacterium haemophilum]AKN16964.1 ribonuclease [Mycobacterium haemophilum DSM 44634]KLO32524.1 ribonuclease [Mycobacterium haemophilum]KLO36785.1 ribonuclease [Mycobacterium haemophilum]KLO42804.1 ribonuclease [Mycobacterium haemophilum]KLO55823.1 ribonuclease [Mycobacterium haemophilum]
MALLDVNSLIALAWDSHIHHVRMREWFAANAPQGWATCPITESGFVRVSTNPKVLPSPIGMSDAQHVLISLRGADGHQFLFDDVSITDDDVPTILGHRQVTDAHLLTLARRRGVRLVTFDAAIVSLAQGRDVELLTLL